MANQRGMTLVELLACLVIAAVVLGLGLPAFGEMIDRARVLNGFHAMTASLMSARMAAINRGVPVTVCPSADGLTCRSDRVWEEGWIVYLDPGRRPRPASRDDVLVHIQAQGPGLSIQGTSGRHRVRYQPTGLSGGNNLTLRFCSGRAPSHVGDVIVNQAGRPRTRRQDRPDVPCPHRR